MPTLLNVTNELRDNMSRLISIITPVFNGIRFIEKCINSIISQNCPYLEHIIVDGASTDGTIEVIKKYASKFDHIRWVTEKDQGQSDAMNKGVVMAQGNILCFLNVDDFHELNVLNRIYDIFQTLPEPTLLVGNCNILNDDDEVTQVNRPRRLKITDLMMGWPINPYPTNPSQYFYHKSLHDLIGPYDVNEHYTLDIDFLSRAVQNAHVKYVNETWGNYRKIRGTKTVNDIENGLCGNRFKSVLSKYYKNLTLYQKIIVKTMKLYHITNKKIATVRLTK